MTLGEKIRRARIERGMTQKDLVGDYITRNMLSKIENNGATPSVRTLEYIAGRLDLPTGYFLGDFTASGGMSPDGLDDMRAAYKEGRYYDCIALLEESKTAGSTDEGYLLRALASLSAAREAFGRADYEEAKQQADAADYYNKEGMYYSAEIDAEMSLILAECALYLDISEFEENAREYERAVRDISFSARYRLARAQYLIRTGETEAALLGLEPFVEDEGATDDNEGQRMFLLGKLQLDSGDCRTALEFFEKAEKLLTFPSKELYAAMESCCQSLEDYKRAYEYVVKQRDIK